ncbi:MAG: TIGR01777 family protein [Acidobacteria bacterium]|nr:MAG: TIGR01777 family protein [Acidobacteriota bacterium]REK01958.1 MAG: TIGR01777 family protein [Acidobacteriota bacterium]REK14914.1 MAG: TIGR01777 family protein [Acidobacteriota bacterium]REK45629.1 MAG: TIGR01777 family protein [Acidobacteriota bacterium]
MKILVTGATGLIGSSLVPELEANGHEVYRVSRSSPESPNDVQWDPYDGFSDEEASKLEGTDAVVHLAGESIAEYWTDEKKESLRKSRVEGTRTLVSALAERERPPRIFVSASAVGYYGSRGDEELTEDSEPGNGFLPEICIEWEAEAKKAEDFGARVVNPRIGVVLAKDGGALAKMLTPFSFGLGGTVGPGDQWMSWIALPDLVRLIQFLINNNRVTGPVNATAPNPVTNEEFTDTLGTVLNRPTIIPVPGFGVKLLFGEMGERLLLEGAKVLPARLSEAGFKFDFAELEGALRKVLK